MNLHKDAAIIYAHVHRSHGTPSHRYHCQTKKQTMVYKLDRISSQFGHFGVNSIRH